ncbi:MAG: hypothetical protein IKR04_06000 [Clostridia bacterium]|nr:hypothetical protein [Clostridia bacterium]
MEEELNKKIKELALEYDKTYEELSSLNEQADSKDSIEELEQFLIQLKKVFNKLKDLSAKLKGLRTDIVTRDEKLKELGDKFTALTIEAMGGFKGEREVLDKAFEELDLLKKLEDGDTLIKNSEDTIGSKTYEIDEKKKQRDIDDFVKPLVTFLKSDYPEKDTVVLRKTTYNVLYNDQGPTGIKTASIPMSKARQKIIELSGEGHLYNFGPTSHNLTLNPDGDYMTESKKTSFLSQEEVASSKDYDGLNAMELYKRKVQEVANDPKYDRPIDIKIPVYECTSTRYHSYRVKGYAKVTMTEAELARKLGMLVMDLNPLLRGTLDLETKTLSATEYFEKANSPELVEPKKEPEKPKEEPKEEPDKKDEEDKKPRGLRRLFDKIRNRDQDR